ncbi:MAG: acetyl-CoA acyltransferase [Omnitrophica bacterium RIFCSPLOWO2_12_FULL_44_17]|uniref:Acetyl-CoA acyltransferase n=1 Tax=Candidatus Danuiimicrobium aquiferis TaxID=1801832 RepID=A0A1G1L2G6_9BACT|nr:MAG: acetyl-CoA acyltransferase [Omnitrophica bacterium RIFCSPHIGHO2_02_FULL_45_28]OGW99336.1 MAG: acetyl-CoA acyltransferase [Omnitrophica bacterium RIFCSPLOWO2_12_FULL_44_17]OGX05098.1 MAG: acetyl-CoA acyltransferase [Omnitrophica bacterium RIFCSPLOWO2_02_FULL_44_11]
MGRIAIVEGIRTPFIKAWTLFEDVPSQRLGALAVRELLERTHIHPDMIDEVIIGTVAQPVEAVNIARVISLYAGIPKEKKAYTISRNCASGFEAVTSAYEKIKCGFDEIVIAGGTESMSNIPFVFGKEITKLLMQLNKAKNLIEKLAVIVRMRFSHFKPVVGLALGLTDSVCGLNMGQTAEILAKEFDITRREQDEFALMSHQRAIESRAKQREEIVPVIVPPDFDVVAEEDNGPRENQTMKALRALRPYFDRHNGTVTVGNSCQVTDGACALLVMDEVKAKQLGYEPLGYVRAYDYAGLDPSKMGLGPAFAIPKALARAKLKLADIDLFEINEAFAAQVIACVKALASKKFAEKNLSLPHAVGEIDVKKLNVNGGAIALGHPVGTSGARLILTLLKEMRRRNAQFGMASLCIGGGQGGAVVLER